jgi:hypothetical protein
MVLVYYVIIKKTRHTVYFVTFSYLAPKYAFSLTLPKNS